MLNEKILEIGELQNMKERLENEKEKSNLEN